MKEKETAIKSVMTETRASRFQLCALFILVSSSTTTTTIVSQSVSSSSWPWEEESRSSCDTNNNKAALFVFGDSLYDPGNNNYITTTNTDFLANFRPYGQSFFPEPTGRFSDGRLIPDFICEYARLPRIPPYLQPGNHQFVYGANFASGGAGALDETYPGLVVNLNTQLNQFENVTYHLKHQLGDKEAVDLLNQSVYMFSIGGNDYLSPTRGDSQQSYTQEQYRSMIIGNLTSVIKAVYKTGGRKFSFVTLPPLGCWPSIKAKIAAGSKTSVGDFCNKDLAKLVQDHNNAISQNLNKLEKQLKGFMYSIFDLHTTLSDRMNNASKYGFKNGDSACCGSGPYRGVYSCGGMRGIKEYQVCENASEYVFFDSNHSSEAAYQQLANLMWEASFTLTGPTTRNGRFPIKLYQRNILCWSLTTEFQQLPINIIVKPFLTILQRFINGYVPTKSSVGKLWRQILPLSFNDRNAYNLPTQFLPTELQRIFPLLYLFVDLLSLPLAILSLLCHKTVGK